MIKIKTTKLLKCFNLHVMNLEYMNVSSYQKMFYSVFNFFEMHLHIYNAHTHNILIYLNIILIEKGVKKIILSKKNKLLNISCLRNISRLLTNWYSFSVIGIKGYRKKFKIPPPLVGYMMSLFQKISTTNIITRIQRLIIDLFSFSFSL